MTVNQDNYYGDISNKEYMSASQFKDFMRCEAMAKAKVDGEFELAVTDAMLIGSYFESIVEGTHEQFQQSHPEMFRKGTEDLLDTSKLLKVYADAWRMYDAVKDSELWQSLVTRGETQKIVVGDIEGVPFKGMLDVYNVGHSIVDIKTTRSFGKVWSDEHGAYTSFAHAYNYDIQGAVYRELIKQETGDRLPVYLAVVTKEDPPDYGVMEIDSKSLDDALEFILMEAPRFQLIKEGIFEPERCEKCDYCKATRSKTDEQIRNWKDFTG